MGSVFGGSLNAAVAQYLQLFDAAGQLSRQPDAAVMLAMDLFSSVGPVMSPLQKARLLALSRPLHPDLGTTVREWLDHHGLLEQAGVAAAAGEEAAAAAAGEEAPAPAAEAAQNV